MRPISTTRRSSAPPAFVDLAPRAESLRQAALDGLGRQPKSLPAKFFYDAEGSRLFDAICDLPEYYPTRTEIGILADSGAEMACLLGPGVELVELGSGSSVKVRLLLDRLADPAGYVGIDISGDHLRGACARLSGDYPGLPVTAVCADYMRDVALPAPARAGARRVAFFPGSTIGNLDPEVAGAFLVRWRPLLAGGGMLVGVDLRKDPAILDAAYNDAAGVTAAFNLNLLARLNREAEAGFDLSAFAHRAFFNTARSRVEMHLVSRRDQIVPVAGRRVAFTRGETIHTENSYKYGVGDFQALARQAGYAPRRVWTDPAGLFSVHWLEA